MEGEEEISGQGSTDNSNVQRSIMWIWSVRVSLVIGRRKEILHKRWDENVYQPIQDQINRKLNAEYDSFLERKINIYDQYLNVSIIFNLKKRQFS